MELVELNCGSRAWGIHDEMSDIDRTQIFMPKPAQVFGFEPVNHNRQIIAGDTDLRRISLMHFANQVMAGNANFVMLLWMPVGYESVQWRDLQQRATDLFNPHAFANSACHIGKALIAKGVEEQRGKTIANGMAALMFAEDLLGGIPSIPLSENKTAVLKSIRENAYVMPPLLGRYYEAINESAQRWDAFDRAEAVRIFMQVAWSLWL